MMHPLSRVPPPPFKPLRLLTEAELDANPWAACGQSAVAALLSASLVQVRHAFPPHTWVNLTQMQAALTALDVTWKMGSTLWPPQRGLAQIQWAGPWTEPGVRVHEALKRSHWIAVRPLGNVTIVFDVNVVGANNNGGWSTEAFWREQVAPFLTEDIPKAYGTWHVRRMIEVTS